MDFQTQIGLYIKLRNRIKEEDKQHEEKMKPHRELLLKFNNELLQALLTTKQDSAKTELGTAYKKVRKSATIADASAFRRHVIGSQDFDLVDWRANALAVNAFIKEHKEPPPGVNYAEIIDVGVRSPGKKEDE